MRAITGNAFPVHTALTPRGEAFLRPCQHITVRYGTDGKQVAEVIGLVGRAGSDRIKVRKYLRNSRRWTGPVRIHASEIIALDAEEVLACPPLRSRSASRV